MTASVRRPSLRLRLALGTALAGGTLLVGAPSLAQQLPQGGNVILPAAGTVTVNGGAGVGTINPAAGDTTLDIGLLAPATVINWTSFNVVGTSAAAPATVNFSAAAPNSVVVNRVTGAGASNITDGRITTYATLGQDNTRQNTSVWLLNPNGVLIGGSSVLDAGAFMGSTLDICGNADCTDAQGAGNLATLGRVVATPLYPTLRLFGPAASTAAVRVGGSTRITTGGTLVFVGGAVEVQPGTEIGANGDVNLVAATDVRVSSAGSPLVYQINAGTQVAGTLITTGGNIAGDSVVIAAARPDGLAEALLSLGGTVTARGVATGARGVVLLGGRTEPAIAIPGDPRTPPSDAAIAVAADQGGPVGITSSASLNTPTLDVIVNGTGAVTVAGSVSAQRDYRVTGRSVALGAAATTVSQAAGRDISVRATGGDLSGLGSLTLRSNRAGATGGTLTLASAGAIGFGPDTAVIGGDGTAAGAADIRLVEAASATATGFGTISGRSLGRIAGTGEDTPQPLTLYGTTTLGTTTLDRDFALTVLNGGGGAVGSLTATSITTGVHAADDGTGFARIDGLRVTAAGSVRLGAAESRTGSVIVTAQNGDVTGLAADLVFGATTLTAALGGASAPGVLGVNDGSVAVYAGRSSTGALTATGTNGLARIGTATAGGDVTVLAQKIGAGTIRAAVASATPITGTAPGGSVTLHAFAHEAGVGAVDLQVASASAGTGATSRQGLDVLVLADAAGGTVLAGSLNADRSVSVVAGNGADGTAAVTGAVRAGRLVPAGEYSVTAGQVTLGTALTAVEQSAAAATTIRATVSDITGLGTLTLQSNRDGAGTEALTLDAARLLALDSASRLFAGDGTAGGNSDLLVRESAAATATSFGQVRARRLDSAAGGALVLYGPTSFGTVDLDRSLTLTIADGGGGASGTLASGALTLGVHPADDGTGSAIADTLLLATAGSAHLTSATSRTGSLSITAVDGDVTGPANGGGFGRVALTSARADATATPRIADGSITVLAGRSSSGARTATGTNGLALLGSTVAGGDIRADAQGIDAILVQSDRGSASLNARAADGVVSGAMAEVLTAGSINSGLATTLAAEAGSIRVGTVSAGRTAVQGTTDGTVRIDAYGNARLGLAAPTAFVPGGISTLVGDIAVRSLHGDITGGEATPSSGRADLLTLDGNASVVAAAQALGATPVGLVQLGTVLASTTEAQVGAAMAPTRGNVLAVGRVVDVTSAETASLTGAVGGSLYLQGREGTATDDVHVTLATGLVGTTATLIAGTGSLGGATDPNGSVFVGSLESGRNRLVGPGAALPGTITIDAVDNVRADTLDSRTGNVSVTAGNGDVSGYVGASGRPAITAALATPASGADRAIADGSVTVRATSPLANRGVVTLGRTRGGDDVLVEARAIDAAAQVVSSDRRSVALTARSGNLILGTGIAGADILLDAAADTVSARGPGNAVASFLTAGRHVGIRADADASITNDVAAGGSGTGYYRVTAGGTVVLGDDVGAPDSQSAVDDVTIRTTGSIIGNRGLALRSNSSGQADGTGEATGVRELTLDSGSAISLALPDGLSVAARDAVAARLIGGSDAAPQQSAVRVRAGAGTVLTLGNVTARALRSIGATPVVANYPEFAARAGADPLYHAGDISVGNVDVAETLGIFAYGAGADRLLQIDSARSRTGNVELVATGDIRGYRLTAPGGAAPLGVYVASDLTADNARVDAYAGTMLLDDVAAGAFAGLETFGGRLRVDTVTTGTSRPIAESGISLIARSDLRLTSAAAARGAITARATTGSVTGLPVPDDGSAPTAFAPVTRIEAGDGNLAVTALGGGTGTGLVAATTLAAGSSETPGASAPARGSLSVVGQQIGVGTATAGLGSLSLYARPGAAAPVATGVLLGIGSAGTVAAITVDAGGISAPTQANGSAVVGTLTAGTNALSGGATAIAGDAGIAAAGNIRAGTVESRTGSVTLAARAGDVTGLDDGTGTYGRVNLTAATAQAAAGGNFPIANGAIAVYAGRDASGASTATGSNGLARLGTLAAGGGIMVLAQAIDATAATSTNGAILARAYAADGAIAGAAREALVLGTGTSGLGTILDAPGGSARATTLTTGQLRNGTPGDIVVDAAGNVRLGTARSDTGNVAVTARGGDVSGLADAGGFGRATLIAATRAPATGTEAAVADGSVAVYAGRDASGALTAIGDGGLARLNTATAGANVALLAQAIDAIGAEAIRGTITARAFAADGEVPASGGEALVLQTAASGLGATLTSAAGSIRATNAAAGQGRNGVAGDLVIDAARNVTLATGTSTTGSVSVTARDGTAALTALTAAIGSAAQGSGAAIADGNVAIYAGRDASALLTATGSNGLAQLGTVTAGNNVTVFAQAIDAGTVQAAAVSATPLSAGAASGTATLHAYAHTTPGATDLTVAAISAGTASAIRRGLDVVLIADAPGGTLRATTVSVDRNASAFAGSGTNGEATLVGEVRAGRSDPAGAYSVTAGRITLGTAAAPVEQSARGAVAITSTATDIVGLGTLTLQSNSDGPGREPLTLRAARGIVLTPGSRLFAGTDTAPGTSDILVAEGVGATLTTFGQVRGRSLGGIPSGAATAPVPLTLYGATTFGTVDLDRSLDLTVVGPLTTGPLTVGRYPVAGIADAITISASGPARFASLTSRTGAVGVTVTGTGQSLTADGPIDAVNAILLNAAQDVTMTTVTSSAGRVQIGAITGTASGDRVTAPGGNIDVNAGTRAAYTTLIARDANAVTAGTIGVTTATAGTSLAMTATGVDTGAANGEALVLTTGSAGTTTSLTATNGSVRATTIDSGQARHGTIGNLTVTAARNVSLESARSATGNVTVTARDGTVAATTVTAAIASTAQGANSAIADGNIAVYAGRDPGGALTATGGNGLAQLGTVTAGNNVTVLAQKIDMTTVQAAAVSATPLATGAASGTATLTAYAHDPATGAVDLRVDSVAAGTGSTTRRGQDVILAAGATGGTLQATTLDADRNVSVTAGSGTNGAATVSGGSRAGRVDPAGTYTVRAGVVTLGTAGQTVEQSAAAVTSITATAGGVTGLGTLTVQSNRDGSGAEPLEVRAAGGSVFFDPTSTLRGGQASAGSNATVAATGVGANVDVGTVGTTGSTATLQADGSVTTRALLTAATATLQAGGAITTNGTVTAPTTTFQAGGAVTTNGAVTATTLGIQADGAIVTNGALSAPTVTFRTGTSATVNGALSATTATLRAVGRVSTTAPITATTLTVQSAQVSFGNTLNATTIGLYNQATTANRTRLGGTASANETAFEVDQSEFNRITATTLLIGSGADDVSGQPLNSAWLRQDTDIGALTIAAGTGSTAIKVLGTAAANTITVNGAVQMNGGTASRTQNTRVLQFGGAAANTTSEIGQIRVVNDGAATGNTGSIATGGGVLDLRAALILAGKQSYIDEVTRPGVDLSRNFISNPNSSLYGAGPNGYLTTGSPVDLITTGQLKLQFSNVALFQNTSRPGAIPTGVTVTGASSTVADGQPLVLRSGSTAVANGFALFGKFQPSATETFFSTQAALLGPNFISNGATSSNGVNPVSARLNGCLLSSASGGCLASSIAQPTLNVFDVTRDQVLRGSDNLVVTFDPLVGSNNEALFGDIAAGDFDLQPCPDGTTSVQCKTSGGAKP